MDEKESTGLPDVPWKKEEYKTEKGAGKGMLEKRRRGDQTHLFKTYLVKTTKRGGQE